MPSHERRGSKTMTTQHDALAAIREALENIAYCKSWTMNNQPMELVKHALAGLKHLTRLEAQRGWQPIETCPMDETRFLAVVVNGNNRWVQVLRYSPPEDENGLPESYRSPDGAWYGKQCVTHWQPLPAPPKAPDAEPPTDNTLSKAYAMLSPTAQQPELSEDVDELVLVADAIEEELLYQYGHSHRPTTIAIARKALATITRKGS